MNRSTAILKIIHNPNMDFFFCSNFRCQSCIKSQVSRPASTPHGISEVCQQFSNITNSNQNSISKKPGSPCRPPSRLQNKGKVNKTLNQFLQHKIKNSDELRSNEKLPQPALRSKQIFFSHS